MAVPVAVFDLDGTLTDPKVGITRSVHYALVSLGVDVDDLEFLTAYIGPPLQDSFASIAGLSAHDTAKAVGKYREYFTETGIYENRVYPGIPECLGFLGVSGWRLAVATSKPTVFAKRILAHFHLRSHFEAVVGSELDGSRRHKPHVITHALALLGVDAGPGCVMVGDREHDVMGARRVGIRTIGAAWGYGMAAELTDAGADLLVHDVGDLPEAMERRVASPT